MSVESSTNRTAADLTTTDGTRIYVPADDHEHATYSSSTPKRSRSSTRIPALGNNAVALLDGSLWTADSNYGLMQRHDI